MSDHRKCSKPGCGALSILGKACLDRDCPQTWVHYTAHNAEIDRLTRELAEAREALDEIAFPISAMRKRAEAEGNKLDGMMANYLAKDPEYLRGIAVSALKEKP